VSFLARSPACAGHFRRSTANRTGGIERRYLVVPGLRSSRTYVLDTRPDPRAPSVVREIGADELANKAG
jgi:hypothetical protein